jgi:transcription initiation factor TFIIIB Brf1 subunit/transcription initiation factor TFIIB
VSLQVVEIDTDQLIRDACDTLELRALVGDAIALYRRVNDELPILHSVSWRGRSAAVVYAVARKSGAEIPQKKIGEVFGVCEVTVRNVYKRVKLLA